MMDRLKGVVEFCISFDTSKVPGIANRFRTHVLNPSASLSGSDGLGKISTFSKTLLPGVYTSDKAAWKGYNNSKSEGNNKRMKEKTLQSESKSIRMYIIFP